MSLGDLNPNIRYASCQHFLKPQGYHCAYDCRLFFVMKGAFDFAAENTGCRLKTCDAVFVPPGAAYQISTAEPPASLAVFNFDQTCELWDRGDSLGIARAADFLPEKVSAAKLFAPFDRVRICREISDIRRECEEMVGLFFKKDLYYREKSSALLKATLLRFAEKLINHNKTSALVGEIKEFLYQNALDGVTNEEISKRFGYHSYHLNRIFKSATGWSLRQFLIDYRLRYAENLLLTTDQPIGWIALESGFSDITYFTRVFRMKLGVSPRAYRNSHEGNTI